MGIVMSADEVYDGVSQHLADFWPDNPQEDFTWTLGPIGTRLPRFRVRRIAPAQRADPWVYATVGAWEAGGEQEGQEFFILAPAESPRHVETLAMVTDFHADPRYRLSVGRTVHIGRPWAEGSAADHLLVALPYPYGSKLEHCVAAGHHVQFLWLVPITGTEAGYVRDRGLEAFERLLEDSNADVIAPDRRSLV